MHNWMATLRSFEGLWPFLDGETFTYAFMDHRGYGKSRQIQGSYTAKEAASDAVRLADHLGWQRFHVVGHSMSGMVAQRLTVDFPQRIKSLVAVTPVPASGVPLDSDGLALFSSAVTDDGKWKEISDMITGQRLSTRWHEWSLRRFRESANADAVRGFLRMWVETDFHEEVKGNPVPALVITGQHDFPAFREEVMKTTLGQWYQKAKVVVFQGSGHHPMAEEPLHFVAVVETFMRTQSGACCCASACTTA